MRHSCTWVHFYDFELSNQVLPMTFGVILLTFHYNHHVFYLSVRVRNAFKRIHVGKWGLPDFQLRHSCKTPFSNADRVIPVSFLFRTGAALKLL